MLKRFFFEAFDTYIALFYLAFVQFDVRRLRTELVTIYTADSFRRLATESLIPTLSAKVMGWGKRKEMAELKRIASGDAKGDAPRLPVASWCARGARPGRVSSSTTTSKW